jgi:uridine kinase
MRKPYIIGIAGGSASGKTSFLKALVEAFGEEEVSLVSQDNYYRPYEEQLEDANGWRNFDLPESIHRGDFHRDLQRLQQGEPIERLEYTFNNPDIQPALITVKPTPVILSEGLFVMHYDEVRSLLDYKVYIHADPAVRLNRRIARDHVERGYPEDEVRYQWENHVRPADRLYLEPYRNHADLVVDNNERFDDGLDALQQHIRNILTR